MAATAVIEPRSARNHNAIIADAYPQAQRIAYLHWKRHIAVEEIDGLVNAAVASLLDAIRNAKAEIIAVPQTTKYLTNYVDWRAKDYLRSQQRRPPQAPLPDVVSAFSKLTNALTAPGSPPDELLESSH